jgi:hypothetical protein
LGITSIFTPLKPRPPRNGRAIGLSGRFERGTFHQSRPGTRGPAYTYHHPHPRPCAPTNRSQKQIFRRRVAPERIECSVPPQSNLREKVPSNTRLEGGFSNGEFYCNRRRRHVPILMDVMRRPHDLRATPMLLAVTPLPSPLTTPPVTSTYFISHRTNPLRRRRRLSPPATHARDCKSGWWWTRAPQKGEGGMEGVALGRQWRAARGWRARRRALGAPRRKSSFFSGFVFSLAFLCPYYSGDRGPSASVHCFQSPSSIQKASTKS